MGRHVSRSRYSVVVIPLFADQRGERPQGCRVSTRPARRTETQRAANRPPAQDEDAPEVARAIRSVVGHDLSRAGATNQSARWPPRRPSTTSSPNCSTPTEGVTAARLLALTRVSPLPRLSARSTRDGDGPAASRRGRMWISSFLGGAGRVRLRFFRRRRLGRRRCGGARCGGRRCGGGRCGGAALRWCGAAVVGAAAMGAAALGAAVVGAAARGAAALGAAVVGGAVLGGAALEAGLAVPDVAESPFTSVGGCGRVPSVVVLVVSAAVRRSGHSAAPTPDRGVQTGQRDVDKDDGRPTAGNDKNTRTTIRRSVTGFPSRRGAGASPECPGRRRGLWRRGEVQVTADRLCTHHAPAPGPRTTPDSEMEHCASHALHAKREITSSVNWRAA